MVVTIPDVVVGTTVSMAPEQAFTSFTERFGLWWPYRTLSVGGPLVKSVQFEPQINGMIYEEHLDGRRFHWGTVVAFRAPSLLEMTWHPAREVSTAQRVQVTFEATPAGTKVVLTASDWHRWGADAAKARRGYEPGWRYVLTVWSGQWTTRMRLFELLLRGANAAQVLKGGRAAAISNARGEINGDNVIQAEGALGVHK